jgi:hypothetical protein
MNRNSSQALHQPHLNPTDYLHRPHLTPIPYPHADGLARPAGYKRFRFNDSPVELVETRVTVKQQMPSPPDAVDNQMQPHTSVEYSHQELLQNVMLVHYKAVFPHHFHEVEELLDGRHPTQKQYFQGAEYRSLRILYWHPVQGQPRRECLAFASYKEGAFDRISPNTAQLHGTELFHMATHPSYTRLGLSKYLLSLFGSHGFFLDDSVPRSLLGYEEKAYGRHSKMEEARKRLYNALGCISHHEDVMHFLRLPIWLPVSLFPSGYKEIYESPPDPSYQAYYQPYYTEQRDLAWHWREALRYLYKLPAHSDTTSLEEERYHEYEKMRNALKRLPNRSALEDRLPRKR